MSAAALAVACLSLIVACLALGWQIALWRLSGPRPRAVLVHGLVTGPGAYVGPVKRDGRPHDLHSLVRQGITGIEVVGVRVENRGRAPVTIDRYDVSLVGGSVDFTVVRAEHGPPFPHRLEAGTSETWYTAAADVRLLVASHREALGKKPTGAFIKVTPAVGRGIRTRHQLEVAHFIR